MKDPALLDELVVSAVAFKYAAGLIVIAALIALLIITIDVAKKNRASK